VVRFNDVLDFRNSTVSEMVFKSDSDRRKELTFIVIPPFLAEGIDVASVPGAFSGSEKAHST
jgi:hypothetical protein